MTYAQIYLRSFFDAFPADAIGGSNRREAARGEIPVDWGGEAPVLTDLHGTKRFSRKRGRIPVLLKAEGGRVGDRVVSEEIRSV